jgi:hypothetical protein
VTAVTNASYGVTIAGRRLEVSGDAGLAAVGPAFAGIMDCNYGPSHATLKIETDHDPAGRDQWRHYEAGTYSYPDGALALVTRWPSSIETFLPGAQPKLHIAASPDALAGGELRGQPANRAIAAWLASPSMQLVHGAAIALDGRGVLIVGIGGRGKSTTALACARAGFSFLGDDMCVVEMGSVDRGIPARLHGVYATAKLNSDSREWLDAQDWPALGTTLRGKAAVSLPPEIRFGRSADLVAVLGVRVDGQCAGTPRRVTPRAAIGMLAATRLLGPVPWIRTAAGIARALPAYELGLDWNLERVVAAVRLVIERSSGDGSPTANPKPIQ